MLQRVVSRFSVEIFCLTVPKNFVEEPFCAVFQKIFGSEKVYVWVGGGGGRREGVSWFSDEIFLSHSAEKFRRGNLLYCASEISGGEKVYG